MVLGLMFAFGFVVIGFGVAIFSVSEFCVCGLRGRCVLLRL